jgi:hypothetical protein
MRGTQQFRTRPGDGRGTGTGASRVSLEAVDRPGDLVRAPACARLVRLLLSEVEDLLERARGVLDLRYNMDDSPERGIAGRTWC